MKTIPVHRRADPIAVALVDDEDYAVLSAYHWTLHVKGYARRARGKGCVLMHRQIMGEPEAQVDHYNGNKLDNQRHNLRVATPSQNQQNRHGVEGAVPYRGVSARRGGFRALCTVDGRQYHLGDFSTPEAAAVIAAAFRREHMPYATT